MGSDSGDCRAKYLAVRPIFRLLASTAIAGVAIPAYGQDQVESDPVSGEAAAEAEGSSQIVVSGIRATIQDSIDTKRESDLVFDALSADEIGDLPALSIGEALETLTGAGSHREQGGATEISIRGLGPFLGSTVINGRAASNGSGDRSVNFSQFPSELFNKVGIYKTQSARLIEGGVAGQITLESVRPIDYGKRRIQGELKLNYNPQNFDIDEDQRFQDLGYRATASLVDQFEIGAAGTLGISLGYSHNEQTNPEQEANVSNTVNYCRNVPGSTSGTGSHTGNCDSPRPGVAAGEPFVIGRNSYSYRQNITDDVRDSFFGAMQWQPTPTVDINADFQYSRRTFRELRNDLNFSEGRRVDDANAPLATRLNYDLIVGQYGDLLQFTGESSIETNSEYLVRDEEYYGGGLSLAFEASDRLKLSGDVSYSETQRIEEGVQVRMRIRNRQDIFGNSNLYPRARNSNWTPTVSQTSSTFSSPDRIETAYRIRQNGSETLNFVVQQFDPNNYDLFRDSARLRSDLEQDRFNSIFAVRGDATYETDGLLSSIEAGARYQELKYRDVPGAVSGSSRFENTYSNAALAIANQECRTPFPETGFMSTVSGRSPLITIVDSAGNFSSGTNTFATFDARCLARVLERENPTGQLQFDEDGVPIAPSGDFDSIQNSDVNEKSWAGYVQANYDSELGAIPVRGNLGVRVVRTDVTSRGFRGQLSAVFAPTGELTAIVENQASLTSVVGKSSYTEFLPSFNLTAEINPDLLARFAVFRALSRPDPSNLGYGRTFNALVDDGSPVFSIADAVGTANATGNPFTDPLLSWNFDAAVEWYPDPDSILAVGAYYKSFNGGFETIGRFETFSVDGQDLETLVTTVNTSEDSSNIFGVEVTAAHRFSYLPQPFDGLGFKVSYNFADTDFEFQDDVLGAITTVNPDGSLTVSDALIPPAGLFGFSKHVLSAQAFYEIGGLELQGVYKYRSRYFQQFVSTPGRVRYTDDSGVFEARISYAFNRNVRFSLEGLNLFNEPRTDLRPTEEGFSSISVYGPRYYAGVRVRF